MFSHAWRYTQADVQWIQIYLVNPQDPQSISREPRDVQIFRSKVKDSNGELSRLPEKVLFSAVPSRSFFPRGGPEMITIRNQDSDEPSHDKSFIVIHSEYSDPK